MERRGARVVLVSGFNLNPNNAQVEFTWGGLAPVLVIPEPSSSDTQVIAFAPTRATGDVTVRVTGQGTTGPLYSVDLPGDLPAPQWYAFIANGSSGPLVGEPYYAEVIFPANWCDSKS